MTNTLETITAEDITEAHKRYERGSADMGAWVGCLSCYNDGALVGEWLDAEVCADAVDDPAWRLGVHQHHDRERAYLLDGCEEFWTMDHEGLPIRGECSPVEAQRVAAILAGLDTDRDREGFAAYLDADRGHSVDDFDDHENRYLGTADNWEEYVDRYIDDTGMLAEMPEDLRQYFDADAFGRNLGHEHTTHHYNGELHIWSDR